MNNQDTTALRLEALRQKRAQISAKIAAARKRAPLLEAKADFMIGSAKSRARAYMLQKEARELRKTIGQLAEEDRTLMIEEMELEAANVSL